MHHMKLKAAVAKFQPLIDSGYTPDQLSEELKKEEYNYSEEEQSEIMQALHEANGGEKGGGENPNKSNNGGEPAAPKFDYSDLKGDKFKEYMKHIASLNGNEKRVFEQYKVEVIKKPRYKGVEGSPVDIIGIRIKDNKPLNSTLIAIKHASTQNGFIREDEDGEFFELVGSQVAENGRFYLLKQ